MSLISKSFRPIRTGVRFNSYAATLHKSVENLNVLLEKNDRSSYLLAQYLPEPCRNAFLAIRAFNLEVNKINDGGNKSGSVASMASSQLSSQIGVSTADLKLKFWLDMLTRVFSNPYAGGNNGRDDLGEPIAFVLRDAVRNDLHLDISYFHQFLQTRRHFLRNRPGFSNVEEICAYGEGTYSQMNYQTQALLLLPSISPSAIELLEESTTLQSSVSDIAAHIGQATAVSLMLLGLRYYAAHRNQVTLPVDLMAKHDVSQEDVLRLCQGHADSSEAEIRDKLKNVVYDTAVAANDHMLSARSKLEAAKEEIREVVGSTSNELVGSHARRWRKMVPDVVFTPFMVSIPTTLYLEKLERNDFDIFSKKMEQKEWRLAYRSFRSYYLRKI